MKSHLLLLAALLLSVGAVAEDNWAAAYAEQNAVFVARYAHAPAGFKAGLTSRAAQQRFGSDRPVYGSFAPAAQLPNAGSLSLREFSRGMVELELAFQLRREIHAPLADVAELRREVARVALAIELPDLGQLPAGADALQIVRSNVAARYFVVGDSVALDDRDIDQLAMRLFHRDALLAEGRSGELEGGQWQALLALINQRLAMGWRLSAEQWLLTGAIGGMRPLQAGEYRGELGGTAGVSLRLEH